MDRLLIHYAYTIEVNHSLRPNVPFIFLCLFYLAIASSFLVDEIVV